MSDEFRSDDEFSDENEDLYGSSADDAEGIEDDAEPNAAEGQAEKSISSDLIRGHINTIILRSLYDGDKYGYEIIAEIDRKSHGQYSMKQPSLYSALKRLEKDGYITSYWGGSVGGGRRKYFSLTDAGKEISERNQSEWEYSRTVIDSLISDKDFDFESSTPPSAVDMRVLKQSTSRVPSREEDDEAYDLPLHTAQAEEELQRRRAEFEEERARLEEDLRLREEALRLGEEERSRKEEELRVREEEIQAEKERTREAEVAAEQRRQTTLEEERARYEQLLKEREEEMQAAYQRDLAAQEQRIREEEELYFRQRAQQIIHQNYISLVNNPPAHEPPPESETSCYSAQTEASVTPTATEDYHEKDHGYRSVIQKLYSNAVRQETEEPAIPPEPSAKEPQPAPATTSSPAPAAPKRKDEPKLLGRIDFDDLETRASRDGIRITTSGGEKETKSETDSKNLVHKGKALFLSAIVVFLLCVAEGSVALGFMKSLGLPFFYPYVVWGIGFAFLLISGLAYANHYGERTLRRANNVLINSVVAYALCVIAILIIALAVQIDFVNIGQLVTFVVFPAVFFFGIIVFGLTYYLQIRPAKEE